MKTMVDEMAGVIKRPGFHYVAALDDRFLYLEAISRGNWHFIKAHLKNGGCQYFNNDGPMVLSSDETK